MTCRVKNAKKVTCKVQQPKASKRPLLRWSLRKGGRSVRHGKTTARRLEAVLNHLRPGHYRLRINGAGKPVAIEVGR